MSGARLGWLVAVVLGLLLVVGGAAEAKTRPPSGPGARHRHRARSGVAHMLAAYRRELKRSHPRRPRHPERAAPALADAGVASDVAFVTITTPTKGTSFYVDSRRVGTGSKVQQSLAPGYHKVQAVHPSGARWQKYLSFDAGENRELIIHW